MKIFDNNCIECEYKGHCYNIEELEKAIESNTLIILPFKCKDYYPELKY